jgi:hypothetical protein
VSTLLAQGNARKLHSEAECPVRYALPLGDTLTPLNPLLGRHLCLEHLGQINCIHCGRKTAKSFNQGYCYPCFRRLAQCDSCIVSPEKCHYDAGTCREPEWGEANCMIEHVVYLANTSGLKVGITRHSQVPTRWIDQGASAALPVFRVGSRHHSGLVEVVLGEHVADRTAWQAMLKGPPEACDLPAERDRLLAACAQELEGLTARYGLQAFTPVNGVAVQQFEYPVLEYPDKVRAINLDKSGRAEGTLLGIKGQYLILDSGVINLRKYGGYLLRLTTNEEP